MMQLLQQTGCLIDGPSLLVMLGKLEVRARMRMKFFFLFGFVVSKNEKQGSLWWIEGG